jgi:acetyl-CoA C-acetyltransferase
VFAGEDRAKKITERPAWVLGVGDCHILVHVADGIGLANLPSLEIAAREAYKMAGITDPFKQFDVAELYIPASTAGVSWMEALGLCKEGGGPVLVRSGVTEIGGELPINPSGGVLATNPIGATGLLRIGEAALQVMGKAEQKQVEGAKIAVATGFGGCFWSDVTVISSLPYLN